MNEWTDSSIESRRQSVTSVNHSVYAVASKAPIIRVHVQQSKNLPLIHEHAAPFARQYQYNRIIDLRFARAVRGGSEPDTW